MDIFNGLSTRTALSWQRAMVANRMATTSKEWIDIFSLYNSGTYNNQCAVLNSTPLSTLLTLLLYSGMIFDAKKFTPGVSLPPDTFWICETLPGKVISADMTHILNYGYWPSYNRPYFPEVYNAMGYPEFYAKYVAQEFIGGGN